MVLGISKLAENYARWLYSLEPGLRLIDFYTMKSTEVIAALPDISGILLTGGNDLHPALYGKVECLSEGRGIDRFRDELEFMLAGYALEHQLPLLGICRGQQLLNVLRGGSLIPDIHTVRGDQVVHQAEKDVDHPVSVISNSLLYDITGNSEAIVNSSHHQAIDRIGNGLLVSAVSSDGIIEAVEADPRTIRSFCLAVQWHPERMNAENPMSGRVGRRFLEEAGMR
jgi:putative glutamine amidotransferase